MTGPSCASMTRRVAMTSSANDNVGIWTTLTWWPSRVRILCTSSQPEPSTQPPCTTTTFNRFVFFIERFPFFDTHHVRAEYKVTRMGPLGVDELPPSLWHRGGGANL